MKAAIYARVSSNRQEREETIESQLEALKQYVLQKGYELEPSHVYVDDGISAPRLDRPALKRMRDAAASGAFDKIVIYDPDRLARHYVHQYLLVEEFGKAGCEVEFTRRPISDKPEDQLLLQIQGSVAEYERSKISDRSRRGRLFWARQGVLLNWSEPPYGYGYERYANQRGGKVQVYEPEAQWVRRMFEWVIQEDVTFRQVARRLNEAGVPPRRSALWKISTIRGIMANTAYFGTAYYNKREAVVPQKRRHPERYAKREKSGSRRRPKEDWIPIQIPAIIDEQTFLAARQSLRQHQAFAPRRTTPGTYLLRRLVRCGECGYKMYGWNNHGRTYYRCSGKDPLRVGREQPCPAKYVRSDELDQAVWTQLAGLLEDPQLVREQFRLQQESFAPVERDWNAQIERVESQMNNQRTRRARLLDAYEEGLIEKEELRARREGIEERTRALELQKKELETQREQAVRESKMVERFEDFRRLLDAGVTTSSFDERQRVLRLLVEEVEIREEEVIVKHILPVAVNTAQ